MGECLVARRGGGKCLTYVGQFAVLQLISASIDQNTIDFSSAKPGNLYVAKSGTSFVGVGFCVTAGKIVLGLARAAAASTRAIVEAEVTYELYRIDVLKAK